MLCALIPSCGLAAPQVAAGPKTEPVARASGEATKARVGPQKDGSYYVASHQTLTPAGRQVHLNGRVFDLALSPDQKLLAVKGVNGITILDSGTGEVRQTLAISADPELTPRADWMQSYAGIAWSANSHQIYNTDAHGRLLNATAQSSGK
jgi:hypothetical protein